MYIVLLWDYEEKLNTVSQTVIWRMSHKINYISNSAFFCQNEKCDFTPSTLKNSWNSNCWQGVQQYLDNTSHLHSPSPFSPQTFEIYFWMQKDIKGLDLSSQDNSVVIHPGPESRNVEIFSTQIPAINFLD